MTKIVNNPLPGDSLDIIVQESEIKFSWNRESALDWVKSCSEKYVGLYVTQENLADMEKAKAELARVRIRINEVMKPEIAKLKVPAKLLSEEVSEVISVIEAVEKPLAEQIQKFEDERRAAEEVVLRENIRRVAENNGLQKEYAEKIVIPSSWTNRTAVKSKVNVEILAAVKEGLAQQDAAKQAEEMHNQKMALAEQMCLTQSQSHELASPVTPADIYGLEKLSLADLPAAITTAVTNRKKAELSALQRAEQQKLQQEEAERLKAEQAAAREAIAAVEAGKEYAPAEQQYSVTATVFGTADECKKYLAMLEEYGFRHAILKKEKI